MSDQVCGNCQGTWRNDVCLDCGAMLIEIAKAAERPNSIAALVLRLRRQDLAERGGRIIHSSQPSITCPVCGMTSYNPNDIREGFCGNCHDWTTPR